MPNTRPRREDIDTSCLDLGDVLFEVRLLRYELNGDHAESHRWLAVFRSKMTDLARFVIVALPVALAAALALHFAVR